MDPLKAGHRGEVLVVEDDRQAGFAVRAVLSNAGYRARVVTTIVEALGLGIPELHGFDALVVDYRLPDGVGTDLVRKFRAQGVLAGAVMYTGLPGAGPDAATAGVDGLLRKADATSEALILAVERAARLTLERRHWSTSEPRPGDAWLDNLLSGLQRAGGLSHSQVESLRASLMQPDLRMAAKQMGIAQETLRKRLKLARSRLGASSLKDLLRVYVDHLNGDLGS